MNRYFFILFLTIIQSQKIPLFDGEIAFKYLEKQCAFGERYPGSQNHIDLKDYLVNFLSDKSDELVVYDHEINHPYNKDKKIILYNILARYNLESDNRILLMAHWDTREIADNDKNEINKLKPIIGANDGASGIAILMHLSEIFSNYPFNNIGVDLLFVDGEDMGRHGDLENFSIGTKLPISSSIYLFFPLFITAIGLVSNILIIIVSGYFFFTSIFSKKLISCKGSSKSIFLINNIFFP